MIFNTEKGSNCELVRKNNLDVNLWKMGSEQRQESVANTVTRMAEKRKSNILFVLGDVIGYTIRRHDSITKFANSEPKNRGGKLIGGIELVQELDFFVEQRQVGADTVTPM